MPCSWCYNYKSVIGQIEWFVPLRSTPKILQVCQFSNPNESVCILFQAFPFAKNVIFLLSTVLLIQPASFRCSSNAPCDSSWAQIVDLFSPHGRVSMPQFPDPQVLVSSVFKDQTKHIFLHSDMFILQAVWNWHVWRSIYFEPDVVMQWNFPDLIYVSKRWYIHSFGAWSSVYDSF